MEEANARQRSILVLKNSTSRQFAYKLRWAKETRLSLKERKFIYTDVCPTVNVLVAP